MAVPLFDIRSQLEPLRGEINAALTRVAESGRYILGPEVAAFEAEFAAHVGVNHVVGVANGTDAITIALRALGVGPGDDVVVPSFTYYASAEAIPPTGARPVFCDVDPDTFCVTADTVRAALTARTKAVIAVDLFGNVAATEEIAALGVPVVVDAAQSAGSKRNGARAGAFGAASTFSFFPSKNLGCLGDGGAIATNDPAVADMARILRFHGSADQVTYTHVGHNSRLDELQAAVLRVLLPHLDEWCDGRRTAAKHYAGVGLGDYVKLPSPVEGSDPAWHLFVVRHPYAEQLAGVLERVGVGARGYYRTPVHRQPAMRDYPAGASLSGTDVAAAEHLAIPISPVLDRVQAIEVLSAIKEARA